MTRRASPILSTCGQQNKKGIKRWKCVRSQSLDDLSQLCPEDDCATACKFDDFSILTPVPKALLGRGKVLLGSIMRTHIGFLPVGLRDENEFRRIHQSPQHVLKLLPPFVAQFLRRRVALADDFLRGDLHIA